MTRVIAAVLMMLVPLAGVAAEGGDAQAPAAGTATEETEIAYAARIEQWRRDFDADVRDGVWLRLVARIALDGKAWTVGSARDTAIRLPHRAPAHLGLLRRDGRTFRFEPAPGAHVSLDGKPLTAAAELRTQSGGRLGTGAITMHVRYVGDDPYLFVVDDRSPAVAAFRGNTWYPVDPAWRMTAHFQPYVQARVVPVPMTHATSRQELPSTGEVVLEHDGNTLRLQTFIDEDQLFIMFLDPTNGHGTYGGGRFLHAPLPEGGKTELDFNKAFSPYCSLNANIMCPVPPEGNRLPFAVEAGEKFSGE